MARIEYEKKKAYIHSLEAGQINGLIASMENRPYRLITALCFLTMSRVSEICSMKGNDIRPWKFGDQGGYILLIGVEKRTGYAKAVPLVPEPAFLGLFNEIDSFFSSVPKDDSYVFGDPGFYTYTAKVRLKSGMIKKCIERDNRLRKRVEKYLRYHYRLNPHLFRHARYSICSYYYGFNEDALQTIGGWTRKDSMQPYSRYGRPEEIAALLMQIHNPINIGPLPGGINPPQMQGKIEEKAFCRSLISFL
jgi:integrase